MGQGLAQTTVDVVEVVSEFLHRRSVDFFIESFHLLKAMTHLFALAVDGIQGSIHWLLKLILLLAGLLTKGVDGFSEPRQAGFDFGPGLVSVDHRFTPLPSGRFNEAVELRRLDDCLAIFRITGGGRRTNMVLPLFANH
jgi:hypothetical protein